MSDFGHGNGIKMTIKQLNLIEKLAKSFDNLVEASFITAFQFRRCSFYILLHQSMSDWAKLIRSRTAK